MIDSVTDTIKILEDVCEKIAEMTPEEQANFKLDDRLGGSSEVLQKKSIQRLNQVSFHLICKKNGELCIAKISCERLLQ